MSLAGAVDDLLVVVESRAAVFESTPTERARHLAAAGLLHCCALLRGIRAVRVGGVPYISAVLARQVFETAVVSLHLALRGEAAAKDIEADDIFWKRRFPEKLRPDKPYRPEWDGTPRRLNIKELADQIPALLRAQGESHNPELPTGYDLIYRVQSLFGVHAGLSTLGAYISYGQDLWRLTNRPQSPFPLLEQTPALLTAHLAKYVFACYGVSAIEVEAIAPRLHAATAD